MNLRKSVSLVFTLASFLLGLHPTSTAQESANSDATNARLQELQQERVDVLKQAVEVALELYGEGKRDFSVVRATQEDLLEAQLEMTQTRDERIRVLASQLKIAKGSLVVAEMRSRGGVTSVLDVHQAKSVVLRVEILLLKLQGTERGWKGE